MPSTFFHGVQWSDVPTGQRATVTASSSVNFVVGVAPVHTIVGGSTNVNKPVLCYGLSDAVAALGASAVMNSTAYFNTYPIVEHVYEAFVLNNVAPVIYVNVLNPAVHMTTVAAATLTVTNGQIVVTATNAYEAILDSVVVKNTAGTTTYVLNTDYTLGYDASGNLLITILSTGAASAATSLSVAYNKINTAAVTSTNVIGGTDGSGVNTGLSLIENVFPQFGIVPGILLAPGWSHIPAVAAVMIARVQSINGVFGAFTIIQGDASTVTSYSGVNSWKNTNSITDKRADVVWPHVSLGGVRRSLATVLGVKHQAADIAAGFPASASNQVISIDSTVLANGTQIVLPKPNADYLNSVGVVTAVNWIGGWRTWGNRTAAYPSDTDVHDMFRLVRKTFDYVGNTLVLSIFQFVDDSGNLRLIESVVETVQLWLNSLVANGVLLGARIEFNADENPLSQLLNGQFVFHLFLGGIVPAEQIDFRLEFDTSYLASLFGSTSSVG